MLDLTPDPMENPAISHAPTSSGRGSSPTGATVIPLEVDLRAPHLYLNRELSWLEFNARVLAESENESVPLVERLKFHAIVASNLDEFFMVRVAGLKQQLTGEIEEPAPDGMTPAEQLAAISKRVHELADEQMRDLTQNVLPRLANEGILLVKPETLDAETLKSLDERFHAEVFPILTPIAIDPGHPFPHVRNRSLNLGVMFQREAGSDAGFAVVQVPLMLPRLLEVQGVKTGAGTAAVHAFVLLEDLIARHVSVIFPGVRIAGVYTFRVTRNFDLEIDEEEAEDLLQTIQQELRRRERGNAVRLEVSGEPSEISLTKLAKALKLDPERDVYRHNGVLNVVDLLHVVARDERRDLRDEPFTSLAVPPLRNTDDPFATLREGDVLLHHPYEAFDSITELVLRAADDPDVLAIKQTLYRAGGDSPIVHALARAAESGKQVTAIVELKARFEEESNIQWARTLEQSGVHVVYGLIGLKTHAKCLLIIRREKGKLKRYVHLGTGNYNPVTARLYTDISLLTCRDAICEDVSSLFNLLTGYSAPPKWNALVVSPLGLHETILGLIQRETEHARAGRPAKIVAKMNACVDVDVVEALYRASQAGVQIKLLVRGICCLKPGVIGVSDNIEVRAIVDRFLEHARVFTFANGGKLEVYMSSADWMPRNFHRRVEVMAPIEDPNIKTRLMEILESQLTDNVKAWRLLSTGKYERVPPGIPPIRSQVRFMEMARERVKVAENAARQTGRISRSMPLLDGATKVRRTRKREPK
jgi:polyphosphate kinase